MPRRSGSRAPRNRAASGIRSGPGRARVFRDQRLDLAEIARCARLEQGPESVPRPGRPGELLVGLELRGLQHVAVRLERLDVMHQLRPAVEAVLTRERVLRRRQSSPTDRLRAACRDVPWPAYGVAPAMDGPANAAEGKRT